MRKSEGLNHRYSLAIYFDKNIYHLKVRELINGFTIGEPKEDELVNTFLDISRFKIYLNKA